MRLLFTVLFISLISSLARAAEKREGTWAVLEGCQLVSAPFNDGDSFLVKHGDEKSTFRLYFVDALETSETYIDRVRDQARYFSIPEQSVTDAGKLASEFTKNLLRGEFTVFTKWEDARGSGLHKRYFALVQKNDKFLSTELMLAGLARLYGKPTEDPWPGGVTPRTFLGRLKNNERIAQRQETGIWALATGSMQMEGLEALSATTIETNITEISTGENTNLRTQKDRININTATAEELKTLPGIGKTYAARIIGARPIESIESLVEIPGISAKKLAAFSHMIITKEPPPPPFTAAFYKSNIENHLDSKVTLRVAYVTPSDIPSPDTFRSAIVKSAYEGQDGGSITAFIPDEFYDSFINYYRQPGREFTGLLYSHDGEIVMVYVRK